MSYRSRLMLFLKSTTARLAATYLAIILIMSIGFSFVLYNVSSHELGRQVPSDGYSRSDNGGRDIDFSPSVNAFLQTRFDETLNALMVRLVLLNLFVLIGGSALSYFLARRTLAPIEAAMEAQVQFVSDASHELRTPLTAIQASNEVALRRKDLTLPEARALIENNTEDVKRLKTLSDGLLDLTHDHRTDLILVPVRLQDVASEAMTQVVQQATAKDISVHDTVADIYVAADHSSLAQALVILLDNAIKYSYSGGTVYLETRKRGNIVSIDVRDTGIGILASDVPHLYRRFYRADNARTIGAGQNGKGGYGLGLAIAKQIVTSMHGDISVVSKPGAGSTFSISLPVARPAGD